MLGRNRRPRLVAIPGGCGAATGAPPVAAVIIWRPRPAAADPTTRDGALNALGPDAGGGSPAARAGTNGGSPAGAGLTPAADDRDTASVACDGDAPDDHACLGRPW